MEKKNNIETISGLPLRKSIRYAMRHPRRSSQIFSRMIHRETMRNVEFNTRMRLEFVVHMLKYMVKSDLMNKVDRKSLQRIGNFSLEKAIRLALRSKDHGVRNFAALVYEELVLIQGYSMGDVLGFVNNFLANVLRELKES